MSEPEARMEDVLAHLKLAREGLEAILAEPSLNPGSAPAKVLAAAVHDLLDGAVDLGAILGQMKAISHALTDVFIKVKQAFDEMRAEWGPEADR